MESALDRSDEKFSIENTCAFLISLRFCHPKTKYPYVSCAYLQQPRVRIHHKTTSVLATFYLKTALSCSTEINPWCGIHACY